MQATGYMQTALEYASIVLILHIQVQIANQQMAEKYKASFLEDLLTNNVKTDVEIHNRARLYGWDFTNGGLAAVVDTPTNGKHINIKTVTIPPICPPYWENRIL